ncbi:MAG: EamA family transporter [Chloroflexota bacterium]
MRVFIILAINIVSIVAGQVLLKLGMRNSGGFALDDIARDPTVLVRVFLNPFIFVGMTFYVINVFLWFDVLSRSDLSYVYPFLSLGYAAVVIASALFLGEQLTWQRLIGVAIITVGVFIVSRG